MRAALTAFSQMKANKKIAVICDMLELGEREAYWHRGIGRKLHKFKSITHLVLVGELAEHIAKTAPLSLHITAVKTWQEVPPIIASLTGDGASVLLKASLGMEFANLVPIFS